MDEQRPNDRNHIIEFIAATVKAMRQEMGTMRAEMGTMRAEMVTKSDLRDAMGALRAEMATKEAMNAGFTAVRADIERVAVHLDQVDRNQSLRAAAVETEVSRLRSVVYLLVRDQPDLVRMLNA